MGIVKCDESTDANIVLFLVIIVIFIGSLAVTYASIPIQERIIELALIKKGDVSPRDIDLAVDRIHHFSKFALLMAPFVMLAKVTIIALFFKLGSVAFGHDVEFKTAFSVAGGAQAAVVFIMLLGNIYLKRVIGLSAIDNIYYLSSPFSLARLVWTDNKLVNSILMNINLQEIIWWIVSLWFMRESSEKSWKVALYSVVPTGTITLLLGILFTKNGLT